MGLFRKLTAGFAVIAVGASAVIGFDQGVSFDLFRAASLLSGASAGPYKVNSAFVFWGDSLTAGYGSGLGHDFPTLITSLYHRSSVNMGVPGETSSQIRDRFLSRVRPIGPEAVVLWIGRNNANRPGDVERDLALMVSSLNPNSRYLVLGILNSDIKDERRGGINYLNIIGLNDRLAKTYGQQYVAVREKLVASGNRRFAEDARNLEEDVVPASLRIDPLHLNDVGQAIVAEMVQEAMVANDW